MTFQALYGIETTVNFFGKRGMLLHGTEATFKNPSGKSETHYMNHISLHDMKQDWMTVLALFESKVRMLKEIKPHLKLVCNPSPCLVLVPRTQPSPLLYLAFSFDSSNLSLFRPITCLLFSMAVKAFCFCSPTSSFFTYLFLNPLTPLWTPTLICYPPHHPTTPQGIPHDGLRKLLP